MMYMIDATHWEIPDEWRAPNDALTPGGRLAQFRSAAHAVMAVRIHYLNTHPRIDAEPVRNVTERYENAWEHFIAHCHNVVTVAEHVDSDNIAAAADAWNHIDQPGIDDAFAIVMGQREPHIAPNGRRVNLSTLACEVYLPSSAAEKKPLDRRLNDKDRNEAWDRAKGRCVSCGVPTTRTSQHQRLFRVFRAHSDLFDLTPTYINTNGDERPLWSERILIAAKGSPDHVIAASRGGLTSPENLANTCSACQFARGNWTLDDLSVPAYRPH